MIGGVLANCTVTDLDRAEDWYTRLFDREPDARPVAGLLEWHLGEGFGVQVWFEPARAGKSAIVLDETDLDAAAARLSAAGIDHDYPRPGERRRHPAARGPRRQQGRPHRNRTHIPRARRRPTRPAHANPQEPTMDVVHDTLCFTREVDRPLDTVWAAYGDVEQRSQWSFPSGEQIIYDTAEFREGGEDTYRCGPPGDLSNLGTNRYYLVDAPHRLIYSETIRRDDKLMSIAVLTWDIKSTVHGTRITVVDQVTSLVGPGMIDGHRNGHDTALDQLVRWLANRKQA